MREAIRRAPVFAGAFLLGVLAALAFVVTLDRGAAAATPSGDDSPLWTTLPAGGSGGAGAIAAEAPLTMSSFATLAKTLKPTVVHINVTKTVRMTGVDPRRREFYRHFFGPMPEEFENKGLGSGFVIRKDGYLLTNNHVIEGADTITVRFSDGKSYEARVVGADEPTDMALLKIEPEHDLPVAPLGDSDALEVGEWVLAIGNPFGLSHTVTAGIVSAKGRKEVAPEGRHMIANFIQTDASINPGNSGGPLFNIRGEVIGMATAINSAGQGIGFAIPVNMIKTMLPQLRDGQVKRSWLGVMIRPVTDAHVAALALPAPNGAIVERVVAGGPAEKGGVEVGDVIVGFDGKPVETAVDVQWLASTAGAGEEAVLDVFRRGERKQVRVTLGAMPSEPSVAGGPQPESVMGNKRSSDTAIPGVGVRVSDNTPKLRKRLSLPTKDGVVVTGVDAGSPAAEAGLEIGDVVLVVGTTKVTSVEDFQRAVQRVAAGELVSMVLLRAGETRFFDFRKARR